MSARVTIRSRGAVRVDASDGRHSLTLDLPVPQGGEEPVEGMAPHEVLLSSLGGCTAMTLLLYARRKGWALERVEASLVHEKPPAGSGEAPETIDVELRLEGALDAVQREKLLEIAQRCPVHRTLRHGVTIRERLLS